MVPNVKVSTDMIGKVIKPSIFFCRLFDLRHCCTPIPEVRPDG